MKVAFHLAIPEPPHPELDAVVQDAMQLAGHVDGVINYLYPGKEAKRWIPRFLCGFHQLLSLRRLDNCVDLHHVFSNGLYPYPVLMFLQKPVICTSVIGVGKISAARARFLKRQLASVVVATMTDKALLDAHGIQSNLLYPGIPVGNFSFKQVGGDEPFTLLSGSAPWTEKQFASKGIDILLQAASELPWLHLVFLWRGKLLDTMHDKVEQYGVAERVQIITRKVDVNTIFQRVHGGIVLVNDPDIIKSYPHSLLESLAAGKPVVVSSVVPAADYVQAQKCGTLVDNFTVECLKSSIENLRNQHDLYVQNTSTLDMNLFSSDHMVDSYLNIYNSNSSGSS